MEMHSSVPKRRKADDLERQLEETIRSGRYASESAIPSLRDLAKAYGVHYNTAQTVIKRLAEKGLVNRVKRRGVFVSRTAGTASHAVADRAIPRLAGPGTLGVMYVEALAVDRNNSDHGLVRAIEAAASETGGRVLFYDLDAVSLADPAGLVDRCLADSVGGVIVVGVRDTEPLGPILSQLQKWHVPVVVCPLARQSIAASLDVPVVDADNRIAGVVAAQHLFELGHRELAVVTYDRPRPYIEERISGAIAICERHGLHWDAGRIIRLPVAEMQPAEYCRVGYEAFARLDPAVTGVFCINDSVAAGLIDAATAAGHRIGQTLSVVGHDNDERYLSKHITTVVAPLARIGRRALEVLVRSSLGSAGISPEHILLRSQLIWRRSTGAPVLAATLPGSQACL